MGALGQSLRHFLDEADIARLRGIVPQAINDAGARFIDVNEQNGHAYAVYRHLGFSVYERVTTDNQGQPFPILRMKL